MDEQHNPWTILSQRDIYDNPWIRLTEYQVLNPSGGNGIYGKVHFKNTAIGIVAIDAEDHVWLVGQYRFALNEYSWEIPEGGCPESTDPLESAKRELLEETGLTATNWQLLYRVSLSNSVSDEYALIYLAEGLSQGEAEPEETEQLHVRRVSLDEAWRMMDEGVIHDVITVTALQHIRLRRNKTT